jgi:hypothetical protein
LIHVAALPCDLSSFAAYLDAKTKNAKTATVTCKLFGAKGAKYHKLLANVVQERLARSILFDDDRLGSPQALVAVKRQRELKRR